MSELSKRAAKYYSIQGFKMVGLVLLLQVILCVEWAILSVGEVNIVDYIIRTSIMAGLMFMILFNLIYAVYGPNWLDSLVLSMGARRKDIFAGEIIKQLTFIICNTVIYLLVAVISKNTRWVPAIFMCAVIAALFGAIGQVLGFKIKKYGKAYLAVIGVCAGCFGAFAAIAATIEVDVFRVISDYIGLIIVIVVALLVLFEYWSYKLGQKSMTFC